MTALLFALALASAGFANGDWEVAVATSDAVELLDGAGEMIDARMVTGSPKALAYDPLKGFLYFSITNPTSRTNPNVTSSIFRMGLSPSGIDHKNRPELVARGGKYIYGVAYDAVNNSLYWTTSYEKKIMRTDLTELDPTSPGVVIHEFELEIPQGIAIDLCRRYLYWTNGALHTPSIEKSRLDGSDKSTVINDRMFLPIGLTISQEEYALYWVSEKSNGYGYKIERVKLDGTQRTVILSAGYQQPFSVAVVPGKAVYWTDWMKKSVWKMNLNSSTSPEPILIKGYERKTPNGIVTMAQDEILDEEECHQIISLKKTITAKPDIWNGCKEGERVVGDKCKPLACVNYCLNSGDCNLDSIGAPECRCPTTHVGPRCQVDRSLCPLLCSFDASKYNDTCRCPSGGIGHRLNAAEEQIQIQSPRVMLWQVVCIVLGSACAVLFLVLILMVYRLNTIRKRPRTKKRYRINPSRPSDHCEIAIENCCNMNVCETPCYEPEFQTVNASVSDSRKKEENRNLLDNIEVQPQEESGICQ